jgi:hypothetical protein
VACVAPGHLFDWPDEAVDVKQSQAVRADDQTPDAVLSEEVTTPAPGSESCPADRFQFEAAGVAAVPDGLFTIGRHVLRSQTDASLPWIFLIAVATTLAYATPFLVLDLATDRSYNAQSVLFLAYFGVLSCVVATLGAVLWRSLVKLEQVTETAMVDTDMRNAAIAYTAKLLDRRRQVAAMALSAALGAVSLNAVDNGLMSSLDFGYLSYGLVILLSAIGGDAFYGGITLPLLVRRIFSDGRLQMYRFGPGWSPVAQTWSRLFLRFTLWAVVMFTLATVPVAYTVASSERGDRSLLVGLSILGVSMLAALWFAVLPHYWIRESIVDRKRSLLDSQVVALESLDAFDTDPAGLNEVSTRLMAFSTIAESPDSPIGWIARGVAAFSLAFIPAVVAVVGAGVLE